MRLRRLNVDNVGTLERATCKRATCNAMIVLSHYQVKPLMEARRQGVARVRVSLDLNLSQAEVGLEAEGVRLPDGGRLDWEMLEAIAAAEFELLCHPGRKCTSGAVLLGRNRAGIQPVPNRRRADHAGLGHPHAPHQGHRPARRHAGEDARRAPGGRAGAGHGDRAGLHGHRGGENGRARHHHRAGPGGAGGVPLQSLVAGAVRQSQDHPDHR